MFLTKFRMKHFLFLGNTKSNRDNKFCMHAEMGNSFICGRLNCALLCFTVGKNWSCKYERVPLRNKPSTTFNNYYPCRSEEKACC